MASTIRTPGMTAYSGKCPAKCGSVMLTAFQPTADSPGLISESLSIIKNGARCGSRRLTSSTSSSEGETCFASSFIGGPFALPRELCDERRFLVPVTNRTRGDTAIIAGRFQVPRDSRKSCDPRAVADGDVIGDTRLASHDHEIAQHRAP